MAAQLSRGLHHSACVRSKNLALVKCPAVDKKMGKVNFERKKTLPKSDLGCLPRGLHLSGAFQGNSRCISGGFKMHLR